MGALLGHVACSIVLVALGLWHLVSAFKNFTKSSPRDYVAKAWHPAHWLPHRLGKHVELYFIVLFVPVAVFYEIGLSTGFRPYEDGVIPKNHVANFEHSTTLVLFWLYAVVALLSDISATALPLPPDASFLFASIAFALEWTSLSSQAARSAGLESQCDLLLAYVAALCAICAGLLALQPKQQFLIDFALSLAILLQGTWTFQTALLLYGPSYIPEGCHYRPTSPAALSGSTECDVEVSRIRAVALINLAFNFHVILAVLVSVVVFGVVAKAHGPRRGYEALSRDIVAKP